jgi:hypothetical protein
VLEVHGGRLDGGTLDASYLIAIFTALFVAPLVLGGWILAQNARRSVIIGWFSLAIACFVVVLLAGIAVLIAVLIVVPIWVLSGTELARREVGSSALSGFAIRACPTN